MVFRNGLYKDNSSLFSEVLVTAMSSPSFIVNTATTSWEEPPRARHQFTFAAAKKAEIVFVTRNKIGFPKLKLFKPQHNVTVIEPYFPIDYRFRYRLPVVNELYQNWLFERLRKMFPNVPVVNFDCTATRLSKFFPQTIYYCNDEYAGNSSIQVSLVDRYISRCEKFVAKSSLFCVTTSHFLTQKLKQFNANTFEIPLGSSYDGKEVAEYSVSKNKNSIVVGLMGVLNGRQYSVQSLNKVLRDDRLKVVLMGTIEKGMLSKIDNLQKANLLGVLKGEELFNQLKELDVGLALYNLDFVNPGGTPNKVWQYLAVGKPAVVSDLPNLKYMSFPDRSVYITRSDNDLIETIIKAHTENSEELMRIRVEFARQNTWDSRFEQFMSVFHSMRTA